MARPCPISREQFAEHASKVECYLIVNGVRYDLYVKDAEDGTKSLGFTLGGNVREDVEIGGVKVPCMIQANVTCIGSKDK
jgi:hypothetical protein